MNRLGIPRHYHPFLCPRRLKNQATVALSGDGADELFGGYRKYQGELTVRAWDRLPRALRYSLKTIIDGLPHSRANRLTDKFRQLQRFIHGAEHDEYHRHAAWMEVAASAHDIQQLLDKNKHHDLVNMLRQYRHAQGHGQIIAHLVARYAHRSHFRYARENRPHIYAHWR